jgi:hypothetical protein
MNYTEDMGDLPSASIAYDYGPSLIASHSLGASSFNRLTYYWDEPCPFPFDSPRLRHRQPRLMNGRPCVCPTHHKPLGNGS